MTRRLCSLALAAAVALTGACARTVVDNPLVTDAAPDDFNAEVQFWDLLPTRSAVSNDEALHGLFLTADGEDRFQGYDARVAEAKSRKWLPSSFNEPANMAMQRGTLAVAVCVWTKVRGGVTMMVLGPTQRYATRELVYLGIMQGNSTEWMSFSGLEYVAVIGRAQDYVNGRAQRAKGDPTNTSRGSAQQSLPGSAQPAATTEPPTPAPAPAPAPGEAPAPTEAPAPPATPSNP